MAEIKNRATFLPLADMEDGTTQVAVPGMLGGWIYDALRNFGKHGFDTPEANAYNAAQAFDAAGAATTGSLGLGLLGGMADNALGSAGGKLTQSQGIRAYHGSPHDFDRFSLDKIGTGEGAQAYGHGLYFADSEDVARSYRDTLSKRQFDPKVTQDTPELRQAAQEWLQKQGYDAAPEQIESTVQQITKGGFAPSDFDWSKVGAEGPKGRMYEVNINADPNDFLDWDKPLSQQSEAVRNAVKQLTGRSVDPQEVSAFDDALLAALSDNGPTTLPRQPPDPTGSFFYNQYGTGKAGTTQTLREAGIPGIKYLDGMSRNGGAGTSNYVVFDDQMVDILRKYANAPTGAAVPLATQGGQDETDPQTITTANILKLLRGGA